MKFLGNIVDFKNDIAFYTETNSALEPELIQLYSLRILQKS